MNDIEIHAMLDQAARDLQVEVGKLRENVAALLTQMHSPPCAPMQERVMSLEQDLNQAKGGLRTGLVLVALFSGIMGGVAAMLAIFK